MLDEVIKEIAPHNRLLMDSLKINNAIKDVATISKLFSNDALAGVVMVSPINLSIVIFKSSNTFLSPLTYPPWGDMLSIAFYCLNSIARRNINH